MARYIGPTCKLAKAHGTDLNLKSKLGKDLEAKCNLSKRPGQHGDKKIRTSNYGLQLKAKQMLKRVYGLLEKQFRIFYARAAKRKGPTGEILLQLLESRLDNLVYRLGFGATRSEARQLVSHRAILVDGKVVSIPSYAVPVGSVIEVKQKAKSQVRIKDSLKVAEASGFAEWVSVDSNTFTGVFKRVPDRSELPTEFNEQLVVELYSK